MLQARILYACYRPEFFMHVSGRNSLATSAFDSNNFQTLQGQNFLSTLPQGLFSHTQIVHMYFRYSIVYLHILTFTSPIPVDERIRLLHLTYSRAEFFQPQRLIMKRYHRTALGLKFCTCCDFLVDMSAKNVGKIGEILLALCVALLFFSSVEILQNQAACWRLLFL